jgi:vanillate O-demethylase monooxygenase subunit
MQKFEWNHWHPVLLSKELKSKPLAVKILSEEIVLFRDKKNVVHALKNECPHRRMRLSEGRVEADALVCPYHGWKLTEQTCLPPSSQTSFTHNLGLQVKEEYETIWVKNFNSSAEFPILQIDGYHKIHIQTNTIAAPLEIVLDNFTETEHTSSVHAFLGFAEEELPKVEIQLETTETSVRLFNKGTQKPIPWVIRAFLKLNKSDFFIDDWTTFFSPVYTVYDQYWVDSQTQLERHDKLKIYVFFTPVSENETKLFIYTYMKYNILGNLGLNIFVKPAMIWIVEKEVSLDKQMIEKIQNQETSLKGTKLTRFDRALGPNRAKIQKIYRGKLAQEV